MLFREVFVSHKVVFEGVRVLETGGFPGAESPDGYETDVFIEEFDVFGVFVKSIILPLE